MLSLTPDKLQTSNVCKSPSQNKYTSSSQDHFPIAITSGHKYYFIPLLSLPGPCSWDHAPQGCWLLLLWRLPGQRQPRLHLSPSLLQLVGLSWWGRNGTYRLGWEQSSFTRFKNGPRPGGTLHTALTIHLPCPGRMNFHMQGTLGMIRRSALPYVCCDTDTSLLCQT